MSSDQISLPFTNTHFSTSINNLPTQFGQLAAEGYFPPEGMAAATVEIDIENDVITALPVTNNGPATTSRTGLNKALLLKIPNAKHQHTIKASQIREWYSLMGRTKSPETLVKKVNKELKKLRLKYDLTLEHMRMTALKGIILDGAGVEIYNLYNVFGVEQQVIYFALDNANTDVLGKCTALRDAIQTNLGDEVMTHIECLVSTDFFNKLTGHAKVKEYFVNWQNATAISNPQFSLDGGYQERTFLFGQILFKERSAIIPLRTATGAANPTPLIAAGLGHAYPAGTLSSHVTYVAPPEDIRELDGSAASTEDLVHISQKILDHGAGLELQGQMNALPLWHRPKVLVKVSTAASA